MAFTSDSRTLITAGDSPEVKFWDARSGLYRRSAESDHRRALWAQGYWIGSLALSPDDQTLAVGYKDESTRLYALLHPPHLRGMVPCTGSSDDNYWLAFSDSQHLVSASAESDHVLRLWNVSELRNETDDRPRLIATVPLASGLPTVAVSPDGKTVAIAAEHSTVQLWDLFSQQMLQSISLPAHNEQVRSVCFSPDGKTLAMAGTTIWLWDLAAGRQSGTLRGHAESVSCTAFSPEGNVLASSGGIDRSVKLWDLATGQELLTLAEHTGEIARIAFAPDGQALASVGRSAANDRGEAFL